MFCTGRSSSMSTWFILTSKTNGWAAPRSLSMPATWFTNSLRWRRCTLCFPLHHFLRPSTRLPEWFAGMQVQLLEDLRGFHGDHDACAIIQSARAQIPGVEMPGYYHDFLGLFAALEIGDHVVTVVYMFCGVSVRCMRTGPSAADAQSALLLGGRAADAVGRSIPAAGSRRHRRIAPATNRSHIRGGTRTHSAIQPDSA